MSKNKHILYSDFPDIREIHSRVYWGIYSWTLSALKRRWLLAHTSLSDNGLICSPADIVRDYLDYYHPRRLRATGVEVRQYEQPKSAPLYIHPSTIREGTYIDIKSTYFSIVKVIGWDINYLPGQWLTPGRAPLDFPLPADKPARNYLVSIGLPGSMTIWTGHQWVYQNAQNVHINLGLWSAVMDILHSIANIAVALGAIYVHTDGYILPSKNAAQLMQQIRLFRLTPEVRAEGETILLGFANYVCGSRKTKSLNPLRLQSHWTNVYETDAEFLKNAIQRIDDDRMPEVLYKRSIGA